MFLQVGTELFNSFEDASQYIYDELNEKIKYQLSRLRPTQIASNGTLMEWDKEYEEAEPGHRHISHLYGLHPSEQIRYRGYTPHLHCTAHR